MPPVSPPPLSPATDLQFATPRLALWHAYDPVSKSELFSTAVADDAGRVLTVDPIPLADEARAELLSLGRVQAIAVTNANHWRAAAQFSTLFNAPIFARSSPEQEISGPIEPAGHLEKLFAGLAVISIDGAAPGEIALHFPQDEGTLIVGDSLIHFDPYGLALLPKKYCTNQQTMRQSLRQLLSPKSRRIFFAHGLPILNQAISRLESLLGHE